MKDFGKQVKSIKEHGKQLPKFNALIKENDHGNEKNSLLILRQYIYIYIYIYIYMFIYTKAVGDRILKCLILL